MAYTVSNEFPDHNVSPEDKSSKEWILKAAQAIWGDYSITPIEAFYHRRERYREIADYTQGRHSVDKFKPQMAVYDPHDAWVSLDWTPVGIFPRLREVALALLNKPDWNIIATPLDPAAADEMEAEARRQKGKIRARQRLQQLAAQGEVNPEIIDFTGLARKEGEPESIEEMKMTAVSPKHRMAMEMELALKLILFQNRYREKSGMSRASFFDYGFSGYKIGIDNKGDIEVRRVVPENLITNRCEEKDFSDLTYCGEILYTSPQKLKVMCQDQLTDKEIERAIASNRGFLQRQNHYNDIQSEDKKIAILDFEYLSYNTYTYLKGKDELGNPIFIKYDGVDPLSEDQEVVSRTIQVVYKGKWVMGTDLIFDYGLATNVPRAKKGIDGSTKLSYVLRATNLYDGRIVGKTELAMPIIDAIQLGWLKLQQAIAEAKPRGIQIDIAALEGVNLSANGKDFQPLDLIDLYKQTGNLIYSSIDANGNWTNWRPIDELNNGIGDEAARWFNYLLSQINLLKQQIGLNDFTDASTPDPRSLTTTANMAAEGTNNSIYSIVEAERYLLEEVASRVVLLAQEIVKHKPLQGFMQALGQDTNEFIRINPDISNYDYGIMLENKPDDTQRQELKQLVTGFAGDGTTSIEDIILIDEVDNIKQLRGQLRYQIRKRQQEAQQLANQQIQANSEAQIQSAQAAEAAKQQTLQLEYQLKMQLVQLEKEFDMKIKQMELGVRQEDSRNQAEAKVASSIIQANNKEYMQDRDMEGNENLPPQS